MNFNTLCDELGMNDHQPISEKLGLLKAWFQKTVSTDIQFSGDEKEQYQQYEEATVIYLTLILPKMHSDMEKPNSDLEGESLIAAVVIMGFDQVLRSLNPTQNIVNIPNKNGLTLLHSAAGHGYLNTTQILLNLGADSCALNNQKQYPIFSALFMPILDEDLPKLKMNKIAIFKLLKDKGNQVLEHQDSNGDTVLHRMALHGFNDLIDETLISNPRLASMKNNNTQYPIHTAILNGQEKAVSSLLNENSADLADSNGWKPLHFAARQTNNMILEECLRYPNHLNEPDIHRRTPVMLAAELGNIEAVATLISHGAKIDLVDDQGFTVLHHAVKSGNPELVQWLLENAKLDVNARDEQNHTPLSLSETVVNESEHMKDIGNLLVQHGAIAASMTYH
ncbi:ankyrin repeat domain-containing protein [Legionella lytica]|uniref:Ankyrin repeat domain-containing protein n=1 Tax=Legionella lytica TaxID=96232 RepID=A0ABW8D4G0_9GAMM